LFIDRSNPQPKARAYLKSRFHPLKELALISTHRDGTPAQARVAVLGEPPLKPGLSKSAPKRTGNVRLKVCSVDRQLP
jgi:hypothetical protein